MLDDKNNEIKENNIKNNNNNITNHNIDKPNFEKNICNYNGCQRKLKLIDQQCKCGKIFCRFHKFPEDHKCCYNYKSQDFKDNDIKLLECRPTKIHKIN